MLKVTLVFALLAISPAAFADPAGDAPQSAFEDQELALLEAVGAENDALGLVSEPTLAPIAAVDIDAPRAVPVFE